jgi:hypothetical protein
MRTSVMLAACVGAVAVLPAQSPTSLDEDLQRAFTATYNLDYTTGFAIARQAVARAPNESRAHRALASIVWLDILFQRGAVTIDHYLGGITKAQVSLQKPPADLDAEFKREVTQAIALAQAETRRDRGNLQALEDLGAAKGLQATYTASVEGSIMAAFSSAKGAFDAAETLLDRNPRNVTAATLVGTYRYAVATLSLPSRMFAYVAGFGGDKSKAISMLEAASRFGASTRVEASTALALIYSREGRHLDAFRILGELAKEYPQNRLFVLEQGSAAIRAGRFADAEAILSAGLAALDHDTRRRIPGESALWLYKRGLARLNLNKPALAAADVQLAFQRGPVDWVNGRLHLAAGRLADLGGRRADALAEYRLARDIARTTNDPACASEAARGLQTPFALPKQAAR